ncbi:MAG TPA: zinc dependent phospholipase C family protein [Hanamia sp.]|nr:zinc dependent phospholipase C family protein [Hanamia sp.]
MKSKILKCFFLILFVSASISLVYAWGRWGHKHISRSAVFALPKPMQTFYYNHIDFITESAVIPDLRRALINDKNEPPRHFIDVENFKTPVMDLQTDPKKAFEKYDSSFLNKNGYLPWYIEELTDRLTSAFKKRDKSEILFLSSELSHYIADAHMPLHTSSNYNGQFTGQKGIHSLWESALPEIFGSAYNFKTNSARYIKNISEETFKMIAQSHSLVDTLLAKEKEVRSRFTKENMYKKDSAGNVVMFYNSPVFSYEYEKEFNKALGRMVENQLQLSIYDVASYWYTAWVNGGSPNLISMDDPHLTQQNKKNYKIELKAWNKGKLLNLSSGEREE